jgi:hypothetical protein
MEAAGKEATTEKEVMDAAAMKKATDDMAAVEKAAEEASKKTVEESTGAGSSPASMAGAKRAATPSGSNTPQKWLCGA